MGGVLIEHQVDILLAENDGDYFTTAREIEAQYQHGILTEEEYLARMDVLAAKGIANKWETRR